MSDNFWNDDIVKEFYDYISTHMSSDEQKDSAISNFKKQINYRKSKQQPKRDWEIISFVGEWGGWDDVEFKFNVSTNYFIPELATLHYGDYKYTYQDLLKEGARIKSVRRISDNEVFSVGDEVNYGEITYFKIAGTQMIASCKDCGLSNIAFLEKNPKQHLFTTEQREEIISIIKTLI